MKKEIVLKSKNLIIKPILKEGEDNSAIWNNKWEVLLKSDNSKIGELSFSGPAVKGLVKLSINVKDDNYLDEVVRAITRWTIKISKLYFIEVTVSEEDEKISSILVKHSYVLDRVEGKKKTYVAKKEYTSWVIILICLVGAIGMIVGTKLKHMAAGFGIGALSGAAIGLFLDWLYIRHKNKIIK